MAINKLNTRQHRFILNLFQGMSQTDAYINAGYDVSRDVAGAQASILLAKPRITEELDRLNAKRQAIVVANEINSIASPDERKQRLTEILRADLTDFQDDAGQPKLDKDIPYHRAAREHYHRVKHDRQGNPLITKSIKLGDPIEAIRELNKMDGSYAPSRHLVAQKVVFEIEQVDKRKRGEGD